MIVHNNLLSNDQYSFFDIDAKDLAIIETYSQLIRQKYKNLLVIGTGASVLTSQALMSCVDIVDFNILFLDNLDFSRINHIIKNIESNDTAILVISKSGNTHETNILLTYIADKFLHNNNLFIITESKPSKLFELGNNYHAQFLPHANIGGRFAIFTNVGLLPAAVAGVDCQRLHQTVTQILSNIQNDYSDIISYVDWISSNAAQRNIFIMLYYSDQLFGLHNWQRQMYAESLGKNRYGFTPVLSRGTIDQHSQLQLYLAGPADKFFEITHLIPQDHSTTKQYNKLFTDHCHSVYRTLVDVEQPVLLCEDSDSYNFVAFSIVRTMLTIIHLANGKNINPFDQPAVELYKKYIAEIV